MKNGTRIAVVRGADSAAQLARYLPEDYAVVGQVTDAFERQIFIIAGQDNAGWTLDDYVIPRLGSGLMFAEEVDTDEMLDLDTVILVPAFDTMVMVQAVVDTDKPEQLMIRTLEQGAQDPDEGVLPVINGIPASFMVYTAPQVATVSGRHGYVASNLYGHREDRAFYQGNDLTDNQRQKIYAKVKEIAEDIPASVHRNGEIANLTYRIKKNNTTAEELDKQAVELREEAVQLDHKRAALIKQRHESRVQSA